MKMIEGGVTAPQGFKANAVNCGIKKEKLDVALVYSEVPAIACGIFTQNRIQAAPVKVSKQHLKRITSRAIIANSGNANCCTGKTGIDNAAAMAEAAAKELGLEKEDVLVASTGVIGQILPIKKIQSGIPSLVKGLSPKGSRKVAEAIMTTDKVAKEAAIEINIEQKRIRLGGVAKGSGMISPHMATMLAFITTDAHITRRALKVAVKHAAAKSFNAISVDGEMSTNDMVIVIANGAAGGALIDKHKEDFVKFSRALEFLMEDLAKKIVRDGEGATKFVQIEVKGAGSLSGAKRLARRVAASTLFKTALFGEDPNWGRIAAASGSSGVKFNANKLDIYLGSRRVLKDGVMADADKKDVKNLFRKKDIDITIDLKSGNKSYRIWTTDLSLDYVKINSHYTS